MPIAEASSSSSSSLTQASIKIDGINNPSSGMAFVEQFFENFEWSSFQMDTTLFSISTIDRLVDNLKTTSADNPQTWLIQFESIAKPIEKKLEGIATIESHIETLYTPNEMNEAFSKFDNLQSVITKLKQRSGQIIKMLTSSIELAKKYGLETKLITSLDKRVTAIEEGISKLHTYAYLEEMPLIETKKEKINKQIAKRLSAVDINADKTYEDGVQHFNKGDFNKALDLLLIVREYKNASQFIQKIQREYQFDTYLEISNKPYIFTQPEILSSSASFQSKNLYQIKDHSGSQPAVIKNIRQRLNTYGTKFFYINAKNEISVYDQVKNKSSNIGKFTGNLSTFISYPEGTGTKERFLVSKDLKVATNSSNQPANRNLYYLASLSYQKDTFEIILKNISKLVDIIDEKIIYYAYPQDPKSNKYLPLMELFIYDIQNNKTIHIGTALDTFKEFYKNFAVILRKNGGKSNYNLLTVSLVDEQETIIEKNVFDYFKVINDRFYYNVGNENSHSLISNNLERSSRVQVLRYMKEVYFTHDQYLYIIQGNRYRSGLIRFDTITGKSQLVIDNLNHIYVYKYGYFFYKDSEGSLCRVRSDGANQQILSEDVGTIITIKNNYIYYSIVEEDGGNTSSQSPSLKSSAMLKPTNKGFSEPLRSQVRTTANKGTTSSPIQIVSSRKVTSLYRMNADGIAKQKLAYDIVEAKEHSEHFIDYVVKVSQERFGKKLMRLNTETMQETFVTYIGVEKEIGKSKSLAMVLGMLFGWLGIHNFYLQYSYKGFAQAGITLLSIILGAPLLFWLSLISAWVEVILIARGIPDTTPDQLPIK